MRDTPPILTGYLARFDPSFVGVFPDETRLRQLTSDYNAYADPENPGEQPQSYEVGHSSLVYVIDKEGMLHLGFFSLMGSEDMEADLRILANE